MSEANVVVDDISRVLNVPAHGKHVSSVPIWRCCDSAVNCRLDQTASSRSSDCQQKM